MNGWENEDTEDGGNSRGHTREGNHTKEVEDAKEDNGHVDKKAEGIGKNRTGAGCNGFPTLKLGKNRKDMPQNCG